MLQIDIPQSVYELAGSWDGKSKKLITVPPIHLEMEHSLLSISKWESKWKIAFATHKEMTGEQFLDYCRCMTINRQKEPNVYQYLRRVIRQQKNSRANPHRVMSSEYFYWLMIQLGIPFECEKWHFGRLLALIDCCQANSGSEKPMSYREKQQYYMSLNEQRRKMFGTKG